MPQEVMKLWFNMTDACQKCFLSLRGKQKYHVTNVAWREK